MCSHDEWILGRGSACLAIMKSPPLTHFPHSGNNSVLTPRAACNMCSLHILHSTTSWQGCQLHAHTSEMREKLQSMLFPLAYCFQSLENLRTNKCLNSCDKCCNKTQKKMKIFLQQLLARKLVAPFLHLDYCTNVTIPAGLCLLFCFH